MAFGQPQDPYADYRAGFVNIPNAPMAAAVQKPKFFGQGGAGRTIAGMIGDALLQASGHAPVYSPLMAQMREHQQRLQEEEARYQQERQGRREDFAYERQYNIDHPMPQDPTPFGRELIESGLQPGTPEYAARMGAHLNAVDDPIVTVSLPGNRVYSGPRSGLAAALGGGEAPKPVGKLTPIGGASPSGSGGFR